MTTPRLRGEVKNFPLSSVKPNGWNPNQMTPEMKASLKHGLQEDGWLVSQALLVWGTDEKGKQHDVIIDGEHRWVAATELGLKKGPMVKLDLLSEADAKALTVKLNQKRGDWNTDKLSELLKDLASLSETPLTGLDLGFTDESLMKLLADAPLDMAPIDAPEGMTGASLPTDANGEGATPAVSNVRMVQLFLDETTQPVFMTQVRALSEKWGTENVTDTVLRAIENAHAQITEEVP